MFIAFTCFASTVAAMNDAMSISAAGMQQVSYRQSQAASDIVRATTTEAGNSDGGNTLEKAMVSQATNPSYYKANATAFNTADEMTGTLLDVIA